MDNKEYNAFINYMFIFVAITIFKLIIKQNFDVFELLFIGLGVLFLKLDEIAKLTNRKDD